MRGKVARESREPSRLLGILQRRRARTYARGLAVFYGLLAVMGLIPGLNTTLGLIPVFGHDVWLHALTAAAAAYFGWAAPVDARDPAVAGHR